MSICGIFVVSFTIYTLFIVYMDTKLISLKDFEISPNENVIERSQSFQSYIDQMDQFGCKSYWVMAKTGVVAKMQIEGYDGTQLCFIVDRIGYNKASVTVLTLYTSNKIWH